MVRLVFRPYTQIWRSICTSEPLRASTRVSSGFTLFRHSSPSFGSQQLCSYSNPSEDIWIGRWCALKGSHLRSLSLRAWVWHPNTCIDVRLLGPCFKTGRLQPLRQHPSPKARSSVRAGRIAPRAITLPGRSYIPKAFIRPPKPMLAWSRTSAPPRTGVDRPRTGLVASASLSTISRTFWLSFQSAFHLSITLLVRYRSLAGI